MNNSSAEYLRRAAAACAAGDAVLGMHLYLAAFEKASGSSYVPDHAAVDGLRQAWRLACTLKERSLAEYIFEKLEPYLSQDEVGTCAEQLQRLALDKLEEFGLTREDLEDMTDMISQDFLGLNPSYLMKVEHRQAFGAAGKPTDAAAGALDAAGGAGTSMGASGEATEAAQTTLVNADVSTYKDIVGYTSAIGYMNNFGIGMEDDAQFKELVEVLNQRHGLKNMPIIDTYLFRAPVREDANRFMAATLGEIGLPAIRMHMEENLQGMPVLCVMAQADNQPKLNTARNAFEGGGVLMLEDIDLWGSPLADPVLDDMAPFAFSQLSRGAREAISLIRSAVENPEVYVLASTAGDSEIDGFFFDLLEPLTVVDIDYPTASERADLWSFILAEHPSMRALDRAALVRYSARLSRYDIYMAAREALEDAYKASLIAREYLPVTAEAMFEKLAAYQPLDSDEYRLLEDAVVEDFRATLDGIEDLLKPDGE